jgi:hypothetical protein
MVGLYNCTVFFESGDFLFLNFNFFFKNLTNPNPTNLSFTNLPVEPSRTELNRRVLASSASLYLSSMGVTGGVLARILRTAGRQVDLSKYRNGVEDRSTEAKRGKLRPLRIGLDGSGWIARAAHGNGRMLVDDRFLTDYGRAQISRGEETELDFITSVENRRDYVKACTERVLSQILELQTATKAHVTVVLDGKSPPIKEQETKQRRQRKLNAKEKRDAPMPTRP